MKNVTIISIAIILFSITAQAQVKVTAGVLPVIGIGTKMSEYKASPVVNVLPFCNISTKHSYHNLIADVLNQQAVTIQGWIYNDTEDIYLVTGKYIGRKGGTLGIGWEHLFSAGDTPLCFLYIEYDINWASMSDLSSHYPNFGIILPFAQWTIGKRK